MSRPNVEQGCSLWADEDESHRVSLYRLGRPCPHKGGMSPSVCVCVSFVYTHPSSMRRSCKHKVPLPSSLCLSWTLPDGPLLCAWWNVNSDAAVCVWEKEHNCQPFSALTNSPNHWCQRCATPVGGGKCNAHSHSAPHLGYCVICGSLHLRVVQVCPLFLIYLSLHSSLIFSHSLITLSAVNGVGSVHPLLWNAVMTSTLLQ